MKKICLIVKWVCLFNIIVKILFLLVVLLNCNIKLSLILVNVLLIIVVINKLFDKFIVNGE